MKVRHPKFQPLPDWPSKPVPVGPAPVLKPDRTVLLRCWNEFWCAGAVWRGSHGSWVCLQAAPILAWMKRTAWNKVKNELLRLGAQWQWTSISVPPTITAGEHGTPALRGSDGSLNIAPHDRIKPRHRNPPHRDGHPVESNPLGQPGGLIPATAATLVYSGARSTQGAASERTGKPPGSSEPPLSVDREATAVGG